MIRNLLQPKVMYPSGHARNTSADLKKILQHKNRMPLGVQLMLAWDASITTVLNLLPSCCRYTHTHNLYTHPRLGDIVFPQRSTVDQFVSRALEESHRGMGIRPRILTN